MIAAPIELMGERYICVVEVIQNKENNKLYTHEVILQKALSPIAVSNTVQSQEEIQPTNQGESAKIFKKYFQQKKITKNFIPLNKKM